MIPDGLISAMLMDFLRVIFAGLVVGAVFAGGAILLVWWLY